MLVIIFVIVTSFITLSILYIYWKFNKKQITEQQKTTIKYQITNKKQEEYKKENEEEENYINIATESKNELNDGLKALHNYIEAYKLYGSEDALLEICELYAYGLHPYISPEKVIAGRLINFILESERFSQSCKDYARYLLSNIVDMMYDDIDRIYGYNMIYLPSNIVDIVANINLDHITHTTRVAPVIQIKQNEAPVIILPQIQNDAQNVHDSELQNAANANMDILARQTQTVYSDEIDEIKVIFETHPKISNDDKNKIYRVLNSINNKDKHSKYNKTEQEILNLVWNRINNDINKNNKDELILSLANQLISAVEEDTVVCSTGKIMRIMGSLEALDNGNDLNALKPKWAIENEIAHMSIKIRDDVLSSQSKTEINKYNNGENENLSNKMRTLLLNKCIEDYVKPGIIKSKEAIDVIIKPYLDSF
jgi:hypothetical protein